MMGHVAADKAQLFAARAESYQKVPHREPLGRLLRIGVVMAMMYLRLLPVAVLKYAPVFATRMV